MYAEGPASFKEVVGMMGGGPIGASIGVGPLPGHYYSEMMEQQRREILSRSVKAAAKTNQIHPQQILGDYYLPIDHEVLAEPQPRSFEVRCVANSLMITVTQGCDRHTIISTTAMPGDIQKAILELVGRTGVQAVTGSQPFVTRLTAAALELGQAMRFKADAQRDKAPDYQTTSLMVAGHFAGHLQVAKVNTEGMMTDAQRHAVFMLSAKLVSGNTLRYALEHGLAERMTTMPDNINEEL